MTPEIFNVVRSISISRSHAKRIKILITSQKESNISTIDLDNKRLSLLIAATSLYLDYQYSSTRFPRFVLIINSWTLSKAADRSSPEDVDHSSQRIQMLLLPKNTYTFTKVLRELT